MILSNFGLASLFPLDLRPGFLNPYSPNVTFLYLLKKGQKIFGFLTFSGGTEM